MKKKLDQTLPFNEKDLTFIPKEKINSDGIKKIQSDIYKNLIAKKAFLITKHSFKKIKESLSENSVNSGNDIDNKQNQQHFLEFINNTLNFIETKGKLKIKLSEKNIYPEIYFVYDSSTKKSRIKIENLIEKDNSSVNEKKWQIMKQDIINDIPEEYKKSIKNLNAKITEYNNSDKKEEIKKTIQEEARKLNKKISYKNKDILININRPSFYLFCNILTNEETGELTLTSQVCPKVKKLGKGSFGKVLELEGHDLKIGNEKIEISDDQIKELAIKVQDIKPDNSKNYIENEINITKNLNSGDVHSIYKEDGTKISFSLKYYKYTMIDSKDNNNFLKLTNGKNLNEVKSKETKFEEAKFEETKSEERIKIFKSLTTQLNEIHKKNIIHFDIKPENILMNSSEDIRISDYGISRKITSKDGTIYSGCKGTRIYMAPELKKLLNTDERDFVNNKVDIYSLGMTFLESIYEKESFFYYIVEKKDFQNDLMNEESEISKRIKEVVPEYDKNLRFILYNMLQKDPRQRYSTDDILKEIGKKNEEYDIQKKPEVYTPTRTINNEKNFKEIQELKKNIVAHAKAINNEKNFKEIQDLYKEIIELHKKNIDALKLQKEEKTKEITTKEKKASSYKKNSNFFKLISFLIFFLIFPIGVYKNYTNKYNENEEEWKKVKKEKIGIEGEIDDKKKKLESLEDELNTFNLSINNFSPVKIDCDLKMISGKLSNIREENKKDPFYDIILNSVKEVFQKKLEEIKSFNDSVKLKAKILEMKKLLGSKSTQEQNKENQFTTFDHTKENSLSDYNSSKSTFYNNPLCQSLEKKKTQNNKCSYNDMALCQTCKYNDSKRDRSNTCV